MYSYIHVPKTLHFQIRSRNDFFVSNWSDPLDITSFNDTVNSSSGSLSGAVIGIIVGAVVALVLVIGVIVLVAFLCVNHRRKSKLLDSLQVYNLFISSTGNL